MKFTIKIFIKIVKNSFKELNNLRKKFITLSEKFKYIHSTVKSLKLSHEEKTESNKFAFSEFFKLNF